METNKNDQKKIWTSPELMIHGDVDEITAGTKTVQPPSDGWNLTNGDPLHTVS